MGSEITSDGRVVAPLNISAPVPALDLRGFQWDTVDEKIHGLQHQQVRSSTGQGAQIVNGQQPLVHVAAAASPSSDPPALPGQLSEQIGLGKPLGHLDFPLTQLQGAFAGNGFNLIFRPRSDKDNSLPIQPSGPEASPNDNILELNLTTEQLTFGPSLGNIPNRGLGSQPDITLGGLPYLQTVQDATNPATGKGDSPQPVGIHFEPGVWLNVPAANFQQGKASVVRMASIPHGTTINAQGVVPNRVSTTTLGGTTGPPQIGDVDTTPFPIGSPSNRLVGTFKSMDANNQKTFRIPQNLEKFNDKGAKTITTDIIKNPNLVLKNAIKGQDITETVSIAVSTGPPTADLNGGGTANIAFLTGPQSAGGSSGTPGPSNNPNADAIFMTFRLWVERVNYKLNVPQVTPQTTLQLRPTMPPGSAAPTPVFAITTPPGGVPAPREITVPGIQIQSSQIVNLNFAGLTWPHVSVSTLVPTGPQPFQMT